ncbi:MAG: T9SS type A sorting domain-containing protein [Candidatus Cloacimonetes bacterium]|nr:T9SS type A sorting domain-containing protein [Candidatus Cloacimonadota bacterium]
MFFKVFLLTARSLALLTVLLFVTVLLSAETFFVVNSQSRTLSRIDTSTDEVDNSFASLGNVPNKIVVDEDYIWCVNSGDNAIQKISRSTGASLGNILIEIGSNPWDAILHEDNLYVSGLFTGKVYRINTVSGSVSGSVNVGTAPEALQVLGNKLYVCNAGNYAQNYAGSSVSVIDLESFTVTATIPVSPNPQYLASHNNLLHVSCTGNWTDLPGDICIIDPQTDSLIETIEMGGTPGRIWIASPELAYVADNGGQYLYRYHPETFELLNSAANPLANGGSEVVGNDSMIAILRPNWSGNGQLNILHPDLSLWKQYSVAMMPTDLKMAPGNTSADDPSFPRPEFSLYPNPLMQGSKIKVTSLSDGVLQIYNLKGQRLCSHSIKGKDTQELAITLPSGIYFYSLSSFPDMRRIAQGRFIVIR